MSLKKPLVKQRTIKSSSIEEGLSPDEDIAKGKNSLNSTLDRKRVSFGNFDRHQTTNILDDTDSDEENSLGRHNRPVKSGGLEFLFRSSGEGSDAVQTKTDEIERENRPEVGGRPRPVPRQHGRSLEQSSPDNDNLATTMRQPDKPVPSPRSPRQQTDVKVATTPKPRPRLSPRENSPRLGAVHSLGSDTIDGPTGKDHRPTVPQRKKLLEGSKSGPQIPMIKTTIHDETESKRYTPEIGIHQKGTKSLGRNSSGPAFELSESSDDEVGSRHAQESSGSSSMRGRQIPARVEEKPPSRQPKPLPRGNKSPRGMISREENSLDDSDDSEQGKNQTKSMSSGVNALTKESHTRYARTPAKREADSVPRVERRLVETKKKDISSDHNAHVHKSRLKKWGSGDDSDDETEPGNDKTRKMQNSYNSEDSPGRKGIGVLQLKRNFESEDSKDRIGRKGDVGNNMSLGKRGGAGVKPNRNFESEDSEDRIGRKGDIGNNTFLGKRGGAGVKPNRNFESEDLNERVKPKKGSASLRRSASFDAKLNSVQRKLSGAEGAHNRNSPVQHRPTSAKKTYRTLEKDVTAAFEEHVPHTENVIELSDESGHEVINERNFSSKGSASLKEQMSMRTSAESMPKRGPMKASRGIEEMTRSPQLKSRLMDQKQASSSFSPGRSLRRKQASSMTDLRGQTPSPINYDSDDDTARYNSLDTGTIRQAVFDDWMSKKNERLKKELAKKKAAQKEQEEKDRERKEKATVAKKAFESWNEKKSSVLKEQQAKWKDEKKKEEDKQLEAQIRKKDAKKFFDSWKAKKDEELKESYRKRKQEESKKKKKEEEDKEDKVQSASKVYENWKQKKDEKIKQELKEKRQKERTEALKKEDEEYEKSLERADKLEAWKQKKGPARKGPPPPTLTQRAWCPGSRNTADCIPQQVQPVIQAPVSNRSRTLSASERLRSSKYDY